MEARLDALNLTVKPVRDVPIDGCIVQVHLGKWGLLPEIVPLAWEVFLHLVVVIGDQFDCQGSP